MKDKNVSKLTNVGGIERVGLMSLLDKLKNLLSQNAGTVDTAIDKAGDIADAKTQGKYKDTVDKVEQAAKKAVDDGRKPNS